MEGRPACLEEPDGNPRLTAMKLRLLCAVLLGLAACKLPEAYVHNLREVRDPDGSASRFGAPMPAHEWFARTYILAALSSDGMGIETEKEPGPIEDPDGLALQNLIDLAACNSNDPHTLALQVEMTSWLAVDDGYKLARERAVLELGRLGRLLEVEAIRQIPGDVTPAGPDELVVPLTDLVRHVRTFLEVGGDPGPPLVQTCAEIEALVLDRDGARRVLAATNGLLNRAGHDTPEMAPVLGVHLSAARRCVSLALGEALLDSTELVRAAALEAGTELTDNGLTALRLRALEDKSDVVLIAVLRDFTRRGLPPLPAELPAEGEWEWRANFLSQFVALTMDLRGPVSAAACEALGEHSGSGFTSLRWEDWTRWWEAEVRARTTGAPADNPGPSGP